MNGNVIAQSLSLGFEECRLRIPHKRAFKSHDMNEGPCTDAALVMAT